MVYGKFADPTSRRMTLSFGHHAAVAVVDDINLRSALLDEAEMDHRRQSSPAFAVLVEALRHVG